MQPVLAYAFANLMQHRARLAVAILGTAVPIALLIIQISFLSAARTQVTRLYDDFDFDIAFIPHTYQFLYDGGTFDRVRLTQAGAVDGVAATSAINIDNVSWTDTATGRRSTALVIGVDEMGPFVSNGVLKEAMGRLTGSRSILVDAFSSPDYGSLGTGTEAMLSGLPVDVAGHFELGLFFYAEGSAMVRNTDFARFSGRDARETSVGMVRVSEGADAREVKERLIGALPPDIRILSRGELIAMERGFFISTKPIGIVLWISMGIAFLVGAVIMLQVLSTEIANRIGEFATLKAMGFSPGFVFGAGLAETFMLAAGAFLPALAAGAIVLWTVEGATHLPAAPTVVLALTVLAVTAAMCGLAAVAVMRRIARTDPADLY